MITGLLVIAVFVLGSWLVRHRYVFAEVRRLHGTTDGDYCASCMQPYPCDTMLTIEGRTT